MIEKLISKITMIKNIFYLVLFVGMICYISFNCMVACEEKDRVHSEFWPPDLVPHPCPPWEPSGPSEPDMALL